MFKDPLQKLLNNFLLQLGADLFRKASRWMTKKTIPNPEVEPILEKTHPWRLCPKGKHWVNPHPLTIPRSQTNPQPYKTPRKGHCASNPKKKNSKVVSDYLKPDEMHLIAQEHFSNLKTLPSAHKLSEFPDADRYDQIIGGWTQYWNEIFKPKDILDPNFIKALIASESSFNLKPKAQNAGAAGHAHGFIQLTDQAIRILSDRNSHEIKDHLIELSKEQASDANVSVCAGIRWLFHKRRLASNRLKRDATWEEAVIEYKGYAKQMKSSPRTIPKGIQRLREYYGRLNK